MTLLRCPRCSQPVREYDPDKEGGWITCVYCQKTWKPGIYTSTGSTEA